MPVDEKVETSTRTDLSQLESGLDALETGGRQGRASRASSPGHCRR